MDQQTIEQRFNEIFSKLENRMQVDAQEVNLQEIDKLINQQYSPHPPRQIGPEYPLTEAIQVNGQTKTVANRKNAMFGMYF